MNSAVSKKKHSKSFVRQLPGVINSDEDYALMMTALKKLMMRHLRLSAEERQFMRRIIRLIADYEAIRFAKDEEPLPALDMLEHMMKAHDHTAKDLWEVIGDKGTVSKILNGKRAISKAQAKRLGMFYNLSPALFI